MCGIVGVLVNDKGLESTAHDIMVQMLFANTLRGNHGTGIAKILKNGQVRGYKKALAAPD